MFEIFIAIIGGFILLNTINKDLGGKKKYDRYEEKLDTWFNTYTNDTLYWELYKKIEASDPDYIAEVEALLEELPLYKVYRKEVLDDEIRIYGVNEIRPKRMIKRDTDLLMTARGYIAPQSGSPFEHTYEIPVGIKKYHKDAKQSEQNFNIMQEFVFWVERTLKQKGVPNANLVCYMNPYDCPPFERGVPKVCDARLARFIPKDLGRTTLYWYWEPLLPINVIRVDSFDELIPEIYRADRL